MVKLICEHCGNEFERSAKEVRRNQAKKRRVFCSRNCAGKKYITNIPDDKRGIYDITKHSGNLRDHWSNTGYREILRRVRNRQKSTHLTLQDLQNVWEAQAGKCAYTGIELVRIGSNDSRVMASLDKINCKLPYQIGNIQFVSLAINRMKGEMSDDETKEFLSFLARSR